MGGTIKNVVYTPMDGVPTFWLGSRIVAIEAIDQNFLIFSHCTSHLVIVQFYIVEKACGGETNHFHSNFPIFIWSQGLKILPSL